MKEPSAKRLFVLVGAAAQVVVAMLLLLWHPHMMESGRRGLLALAASAVLGVALYAVLSRDPLFKRVRFETSALRSVRLTAFVLITGTAEEIIWRGAVFGFIEAHDGIAVAILLSTGLFAAMHMYSQSWSGLRTHTVTGLGFGLVRALTGSLAASIAAHAVYNILVLSALRTPASKITSSQQPLREINATN